MRSRVEIETECYESKVEEWEELLVIRARLQTELLLDIRDLLSILIQKQVQGSSAELGTRTAKTLLDLVE